MNKLFTILMLACFSFSAQAQLVFTETSIEKEGPLDGFLKGNSVFLINNTGKTLQLSWRRTVNDMPGNWLSQFCIGELCYDESISFGEFEDVLHDGDSSFITGYIKNDGTTAGTATLNVVVWDKTDSANISDELEIKYSSWPSGVEEEVERSVNIYPNPASNVIWVASDDLRDYDQAVIYDLSGRVVKEISIDAVQKLSIDIESLENGHYFMELTGKDKQYRKMIQVVR